MAVTDGRSMSLSDLASAALEQANYWAGQASTTAGQNPDDPDVLGEASTSQAWSGVASAAAAVQRAFGEW